MLLNRVELGENKVIYNRLRNIGPATAGSAGPVPAPLIWLCYFTRKLYLHSPAARENTTLLVK